MKAAVKISVVYLLVGLLWIIFSDRLLELIFTNNNTISLFQTTKGFFYVFLTTLLIFFMVRLLVKRHQQETLNRINKEKELITLLNQNDQFRHLFEQSTAGMVITDLNKKDNPIIYVNEGFEQITGYTTEEVIGGNCSFLSDQRDLSNNISEINQALENQETVKMELKNYRKDGTFYWADLKISPIFNTHNELTCCVGVLEDITEKKIKTDFMENQLKIAKEMLSPNNIRDTIKNSCQMVEDHLNMGCMILRIDEKHQTYELFGSNSIPISIINKIYERAYNERSQVYLKMLSNSGSYELKDMMEHEVYGFYWRLLYEEGFRSFNVKPILNEEGQVLGGFFVFSKQNENVESIMLQTIENYASILSISLKHMDYVKEIEQSERNYRLIADNTKDMICVIDSDLNTEYISPSYELYFEGFSSFNDLIHALPATSRLRLIGYVNQLIKEYELRRIEFPFDIDQQTYQLEVDGKQIYDSEEGKNKILLVFRDITERKCYEVSLNHVLYYDSLTNLPNRYYFKQLLEGMISNYDQLALLVLEFDQIKEISNTFGQGAGEYLLNNVADRIKNLIPDATIARTGEEQFSIVSKQINDKYELEKKVKQVLAEMNTFWHYQAHQFVTTVNIGAALFNDQTAETIILQAELALKESFKQGKQRYYIYKDAMKEGNISSLSLQNELYHALDKDQFEIWYQPQIDTVSSKVEGMEALIRWNHDTFGIISPSQFIPIAEETRWIIPIGTWVIRQVCQDLVMWLQEGLSYKVSLNISYVQMEDEMFLTKVKEILEETGCPPHLLVFEITENMLMKDLALSLNVINELKILGIEIAVDDFGVGYSSLSYLKQFKLDCLKIDRSFVTHIHKDINDYAIVQAVTEMSQSMGLKVIAEGVESIEHVHLLQRLGCEHFQGYWYSKPVRKELLPEKIQTIHREKFISSQ